MKKITFASIMLVLIIVSGLSVNAVDYSQMYDSADKDVKEYISQEELDDGVKLTEHLSPRNILNFVKKSVRSIFPSLKPLIKVVIFTVSASALMLLVTDKTYVGIFDIVLCLVSICFLHNCIYPILSGVFVKLASLNGFLSFVYSYMAAGLAAGSKSVSAGMMPSTIVGILSLISNVISLLFVPFLGGMLSLTYASAIENGILNKLLDMLKSIFVTLIGIVGIVFSGVTGLQKFIASAGDSIGMSTAKFIISGSMPIVGGVVKDAFGTVAASSKIIVSTSGVFGIISVIITLLPYLLKLLGVLMILRIGLILCEGTGQTSVKALLKGCLSVFEIIIALYVCEMMYIIISISLLISVA